MCGEESWLGLRRSDQLIARITIGFGLSLCALTVLVLLLTPANRLSSEFVPMIFGLPLFICGVISLNPHRRRSWIRFAGYVAVIGASGAITRLLLSIREWAAGQVVQALPTSMAIALAIVFSVYALIAAKSMRRPVRNC